MSSLLFAGLDWGSPAMPSASSTSAGRCVLRLDVRHDAAGLAALVARLKRLGPPAALPVAIERPSGLVVDTLSPPATRRADPSQRREGLPPALPRRRGKSDPGDAYILADILRTDGHRFAPLDPVSDAIRALRALVRSRDDLVATRVGLANRLSSLLEGFWPGAAAIFADIDSPIALAFLTRFPTPESARRLGNKRLAAFLAQHRYPGRRSPDELLARLRAAPKGLAGDAEAEAAGESSAPRPRPRAPRRSRSATSPPHRARRRDLPDGRHRHVLPARRLTDMNSRLTPTH